MIPRSKICMMAFSGAVLALAACQSTSERLADLSAETDKLRPPQVSELPGGSAFVSLETRKGISQQFALIKTEDAVANVLLFAGGRGVIKLTPLTGSRPIIRRLRGNFLIRSQELFLLNDLNVVLVDAPSDRQYANGMHGGFRNSADHVRDVEGIINYVRERTKLPVWLVGTSRGTESAAFIAIHSREPLDGVVLTSPISVTSSNGRDINTYDLAKIEVPVQVVFHRNDGCSVTPPWGAKAIARSLPNAAKVHVAEFEGGGPAISSPCNAKSEHGFLYIEDQVVASIAAFIKGEL